MHQCTTCGKAYSSRGNLRRHQETHGEKKACNCGATFNCNEQLTRHKQAVHAGGFKCTKCIILVLFKSRSALVCHNRKFHNTTERVLKCTACGKSFGQTSHLKEHRYVHSEAAFQCQICNKTMKFARSFKRHDCTIKRSAAALHECSVCNKSFTAAKYLRQHSQTHTGLTRPCPKCGRTFKFSSSLSRHLSRCDK